TMSDVVAYFDWLGGEVTDAPDRRARIEAAGRAIHAQEAALAEAALHGVDNLPGLADMPGVHILGGVENPGREGLVSFWVDGHDAAEIVAALNAEGVRTHTRKADHYSGNVLEPLGLSSCVRVSFCHYNSREEVARLLSTVKSLLDAG
ncbi:MAG: aminotransferase class V-fold PLP-dependent enzyme, partial [Pseudomonadota bacterium]